MDFTYDSEQRALRDSVRHLVSRAYGEFENRRKAVATEPGYSEDVWRALAEMGVLGLPFDEADGGSGAGPVEVSLVAQELGRVLAPEPFLGSVVVAGGLVAAVGDHAQRRVVLGAVSSGERVLAFVPSLERSPVTSARADQGWSLSGSARTVPHGAGADQLVVAADLPAGGTGLFLVEDDADLLVRQGYPLVDGGRAAHVVLAGTPATPLGDPVDHTAAIRHVLGGASIIAANEALGAMEVAVDSTVHYLKNRQQFGVPLSRFQALTFRAADLYVSLETTRSLVAWATMVLAEHAEDADQVADAAARAGLKVATAGRHIGQEAIQLHGGIGMTAEYSIGSYTAHLTVLEQLFGTGREHLASLAAAIGDHAEGDPLG